MKWKNPCKHKPPFYVDVLAIDVHSNIDIVVFDEDSQCSSDDKDEWMDAMPRHVEQWRWPYRFLAIGWCELPSEWYDE